MFNQMSFTHFKELAHSNPRIALFKEIPGDKVTPINAYLALKESEHDITLLESLVHKDDRGRYSHLCANPLLTFESHGQHVEISDNAGNHTLETDPLNKLRTLQQQFKCATAHPLSGFVGGMVSFMSYDAIRLSENIPDSNLDEDELPDFFFRFYQDNISFDHQNNKVVISTLVHVDRDNLQKQYDDTIAHLNTLEKSMLKMHETQKNASDNTGDAINIDIPDLTYQNHVEKAKDHIVDGDIFQVVLSRSFSTDFHVDGFELYRALRFKNPTPYMFFLNYKDTTITGASPEKLVSLENGVLESCPLAGTRPRGEGEKDIEFENELHADPKENAEHMMLVDLARNDLGTIAKPGSVKVSKLKETERTSTVMHLSSTVNAMIDDKYDALDALVKSMPAGTLSGAPKIRAMEIIDELESTRRGIYGGAIAGIDANGNLASCIAIRTAVIKDGKLRVRAGAGVVYDSDPASESLETQNKANSILSAIDIAKGELS